MPGKRKLQQEAALAPAVAASTAASPTGAALNATGATGVLHSQLQPAPLRETTA
jgi:hypothetical protein